jgi:FkbM family methyltransferase
MKPALLELIHRAFRSVGLRVSWAPNWKALLSEVDLVIDVGSHFGEAAKFFRSCGYKGMMECFEANPELMPLLTKNLSRDLKSGNCRLWNVAVSDKEAEARFTIRKVDTGSSLLADSLLPDQKYEKDSKVVSVKTRRLDGIDFGNARQILLKVDAEGHDLNIIRGAMGLNRIRYIMMEVANHSRFVGEPDTPEVIAEMNRLNFKPIFVNHQFYGDWGPIACHAMDVVFENTRYAAGPQGKPSG